eukprot:CAMPEP_0117651038 /NCGR_PEP_ID=MMETSP0804-20121206/1875_1 /TAXON_ID=1074897 /ORGANISM="Tetraselmis astigmatica, Strain CCMP880" /LENGTH=520 /DNA_ID=CAMNT_0005456981 /DNA_START=135 /DNA_END=1693 /DNA_ORIENTATION=-
MDAGGVLPSSSVAVVHYPGLVRNVSRAMETLGGAATLAEALQKEGGELHLRFRPSDPYCHPLTGTCSTSAGRTRGRRALLLRIATRKRPASSMEDTHAEAEVSVIAQITTTVSFNGVADFQYIQRPRQQPASIPPSQRSQPRADAPFGEEGQELMVVPPQFSRDDLPSDYSFRAARGRGMPSRTTTTKKHLLSIGWRQKTAIPLKLPVLGYKESSLDLRLQALLAKRPIWTPALLAKHFDKGLKAALTTAIHRACYTFKMGPWGGLLIRRGLDPRSDPECRRWQGLRFDFPPNWYDMPGGRKLMEAAKARKDWFYSMASGGSSAAAGEGADAREGQQRPASAATSGAPPPPTASSSGAAAANSPNNQQGASVGRKPRLTWMMLPESVQELMDWIPEPDIVDVLNFQTLPCPRALVSNQPVMQIGDLGDHVIQSIVEAPPQADKCHTFHGWFTDTALAETLRIVTTKLLELLEGRSQEPHQVFSLVEVSEEELAELAKQDAGAYVNEQRITSAGVDTGSQG